MNSNKLSDKLWAYCKWSVQKILKRTSTKCEKIKSFKFGKNEVKLWFTNNYKIRNSLLTTARKKLNRRTEILVRCLVPDEALEKKTCQNARRSKTFENEENWIVLPTIFGGVLVWLEVTFTLISDPVSSSSSSLISRGSLGFPSRKAKCLDKIEATCESPVIRWNCLLKRNYDKGRWFENEIYALFLFQISMLILFSM